MQIDSKMIEIGTAMNIKIRKQHYKRRSRSAMPSNILFNNNLILQIDFHERNECTVVGESEKKNCGFISSYTGRYGSDRKGTGERVRSRLSFDATKTMRRKQTSSMTSQLGNEGFARVPPLSRWRTYRRIRFWFEC